MGFVIESNILKKYIEEPGVACIAIPENVKSIDNYAFNGCTHLKSITIPEKLTYIHAFEFDGCEGLLNIIVDENNERFCSIDGVMFSKDTTELVYYPAGREGAYTIPEGVITIGYHAFYNCKKLSVIVFPDSVVTIENYAFVGCSGISELNLPQNLKKIGQGAFYSWDSLKEVILPASLQELGYEVNDVFSGKKLSKIGVDSENGTFKCVDDMLFSKGGKTVYWCSPIKTGAICLPKGVTRIHACAFLGCSYITEIELPKTISAIGFGAFSGCTSLLKISIPDKVKKLEEMTFANCAQLNDIKLEEGLAKIEKDVFVGCTSLKRVILPKTVTTISKEIFSDQVVVICYPEQFKKLKPQIKICTAFDFLVHKSDYHTEAAHAIEEYIRKEKAKILKKIFEEEEDGALLILMNDIVVLTSKDIENGIKKATSRGAAQIVATLLELKNRRVVNVATMVTTSERKGSSGDSPIDEETIKNNWKMAKKSTCLIATYIGDEEVVVYPSNYDGNCIEGIADVRGENPENYKKIKSIVVPEGYTSIGKKAFAGCENLENIQLPSSLRAIGSGAFAGCKSLKTIVFPDEVASFGTSLFTECKLDTVELPLNLEFLPKKCFEGAFVDSIIFRGNNLTGDGKVFDFLNEPNAIYTDAKVKLYGITKRVIKPLKELEYRGIVKEKTPAQIKKEWTYSELSDGTLMIEDYKGLDSEIIIPGEIAGKVVSEIGEGVFDAGKNLLGDGRKISSLQKDVRIHITKITVPETVRIIGKEAFLDCGVKMVELPDGLVEIGEGAFKCCKRLESIDLPASLKVIGEEAFSGIHGIGKWILPEGLETIEMGAFAYSTMQEIHIPATVKSIGNGAISKWNGDVVVYGEVGSAAEAFALEARIDFFQE